MAENERKLNLCTNVRNPGDEEKIRKTLFEATFIFKNI